MTDDKKNLGDVFKKALNLGLSAAFMTEEAIKKGLGDAPLSKEALTGLLQGAKNTRAEFVQGLKGEFGRYLQGLDLSSELENILEKYTVSVSADFEFKKKEKDKKEKEGL